MNSLSLLLFLPPRPSQTPLILPPPSLTHPSAGAFGPVPPRFSPSRPPSFLPALLPGVPVVVDEGSRRDWLFLRLLQRMQERDWWVRVGRGHAGWASMWRQENIWFIRPVGQGGKRVTPARRHECVTFQLQSTLCSSEGRSEHAAKWSFIFLSIKNMRSNFKT